MGYSIKQEDTDIQQIAGGDPKVGNKFFVSVVLILGASEEGEKPPQRKLGAFQTEVKEGIPFPQFLKSMVSAALVKEGYREPLALSMREAGHCVKVACFPIKEWEDLPIDEWIDNKTLEEEGF